ncbi:MAG TPA: AraC family transcriptional regulator [Candidatus Acidoferrales bacterium]|nr:AraC family transcriptional regulator [Candidatus Acidoferrales bacterium]
MSSAALRPGQFFGRVDGKFMCAGATLTEVCHPGPRRVPLHAHQAGYFSLLLAGNYAETFQRHTIRYATRSVAFHPPGTVHCGEIGPRGGRLFVAEFEDSWLDRVRGFAPLPACSHYRPGGELAWLAARLYRESKRGDAASRLTVEGLLLEMLAEVSRRATENDDGEPRWLRAAVDLLRAEFRRSLTLGEVARQAGVHPARLSRAFRRKYGRTVGGFVNDLRVRFAVEQLAGEMPLCELSLALGFADQSHFTRVFHVFTGTTPARFRASCRAAR